MSTMGRGAHRLRTQADARGLQGGVHHLGGLGTFAQTRGEKLQTDDGILSGPFHK